jgi:hypothetical protein
LYLAILGYPYCSVVMLVVNMAQFMFLVVADAMSISSMMADKNMACNCSLISLSKDASKNN